MTREDYLTFVTEWKADYHNISQEIRNIKIQRKNASEDELSTLHSRKAMLRKIATEKLQKRQEMKIAANAAWEEARKEAA